MKFLSVIAVLLFSLFLQFFMISLGWHFDVVLAVLIALAFVVDDFWELFVADLLAVFILNWQPAASGTLILFAFIPLVAFAGRKLIHSEVWIGSLAAICLGFLAFYLGVAPGAFLAHFTGFVEDLVVALAVGELVVFAL